MAPDAVRSDIEFSVPAGTHVFVALETKVRDLIDQLVRIGPGMGIVTEITAFLQSRVYVGLRRFVVVAFITGYRCFGGGNMGVVTLLAIIFLKGGMYIGFIGNLCMTVPAFFNRGRPQKTG